MAGCSCHGTLHELSVRGRKRCFLLYSPRSASGPSPVVILHHGLAANAGWFCTAESARAADSAGVALLCTAALGGNWDFGALPPGEGNACGTADLEYMLAIYGFLDGKNTRQKLDPARRFHVGFSQGALFAAVATFCALHAVVGFGQAGSSFAPMKMRVVRTVPPLRVCVWCNRNDPHCHPMTDELRAVGHEATMTWTGNGGHDFPHPWLPKCRPSLRRLSPRPGARSNSRRRRSGSRQACVRRGSAPGGGLRMA